MKNKDNDVFGQRSFLPFDQWTNLDCFLTLKGHNIHFKVMIHPCSDDSNGVIFWFKCYEKKG